MTVLVYLFFLRLRNVLDAYMTHERHTDRDEAILFVLLELAIFQAFVAVDLQQFEICFSGCLLILKKIDSFIFIQN